MILSMIASATVWSAMASYHAPTGICDVMIVDFFPCLSFPTLFSNDNIPLQDLQATSKGFFRSITIWRKSSTTGSISLARLR